MKVVTWRLKKGSDRRFRSGHPWVYSNELSQSPKGIDPGAPVELQDPGGSFLAAGYGNPASLIAFRALSRDPSEKNPLSPEGISHLLQKAYRHRESLGLTDFSFRLCFAEADQLPGLIIDRYLLDETEPAQVWVLQAQTAGMDRALSIILEEIGKLGTSSIRTAIVIRNDAAVRRLEGLAVEGTRVHQEISGINLAQTRILIGAGHDRKPIGFSVDLIDGQKTGFFLDQTSNIQLLLHHLERMVRARKIQSLKVLDLCSYVGHWGTQIANLCHALGVRADVTAVDASQAALQLARKNVESSGARFEAIQGNVLKDLGNLDSGSYDVVICDPPALIKGRKDLPAGSHAYLQLNTQALRLVRPGGLIASCSCSALLDEERFIETLAKAALRAKARMRWIARGAQAPDHPVLAEFPEGRYLKCWIGIKG